MKRKAQLIRAELGCLHCGYDVGEVEGPRHGRPRDLVFLPMHRGDRLVIDRTGRFRCPRCWGQVVVNGVWRVRRPLNQATVYEAIVVE